MSRVLGVVIVAALCAGCRNPTPVYDPFMGRTTVPPPGTAVVQPGQPYYAAPPAGATTSPPLITPPPGASAAPPASNSGLASSFSPNVSPVSATGTPTATVTPVSATAPGAMPATPGAQPLTPAPTTGRPIYGPPGGGMFYPPTSAAPLGAAPTFAQAPGLPATGVPTLANPATAPIAAANSGVKPASFNSSDNARSATSAAPVVFNSTPDKNPIRIVEQPSGAAPKAGSPTSSHAIPAAGAPSRGTLNQSLSFNRVPEITDLPPAGSAANGASSTAASAPSNEAAGGFGYDPQYHWLKGKLEYSQSTRSWRLRYIPPDGNTDNYGGSVILADNSQLAGLQAGDAVYAQGSLGASSAGQGNFAPQYNLQHIQKL